MINICTNFQVITFISNYCILDTYLCCSVGCAVLFNAYNIPVWFYLHLKKLFFLVEVSHWSCFMTWVEVNHSVHYTKSMEENEEKWFKSYVPTFLQIESDSGMTESLSNLSGIYLSHQDKSNILKLRISCAMKSDIRIFQHLGLLYSLIDSTNYSRINHFALIVSEGTTRWQVLVDHIIDISRIYCTRFTIFTHLFPNDIDGYDTSLCRMEENKVNWWTGAISLRCKITH